MYDVFTTGFSLNALIWWVFLFAYARKATSIYFLYEMFLWSHRHHPSRQMMIVCWCRNGLKCCPVIRPGNVSMIILCTCHCKSVIMWSAAVQNLLNITPLKPHPSSTITYYVAKSAYVFDSILDILGLKYHHSDHARFSPFKGFAPLRSWSSGSATAKIVS